MPIVKGSYEAVFIYSMTSGEEGVAALAEKFKTLIADNAELGEVDEWGKRRLAYPINDETDSTCCTTSSARPSSRPSWTV